MGTYLTEKLEALKEKCDCIKAVKGTGLMQGIQITKPLGEVTNAALKEGLLVIGAGADVLRFVPPLIIENEFQQAEWDCALKRKENRIKMKNDF